MRISDDDRQRLVDELGRHLSSGRIDLDDYAGRVEQALAAETLTAADAALRDLPFLRIAMPGPGTAPAGLALPGGAGAGDGRAPLLRSLVVVLTAVLLVVTGVAVALTAQVAWVALLVGGWVLGLLQGRASHRRR